MSRNADRIAQVRDLITGTDDHLGLLSKQGEHRIDVAHRHASEWVSTYPPARGGERGGSSSPTEVEEGQAIARVSRHAAKALIEMPLLVAELEDAARRLFDYTQRLVATIDLSKLPKNEQRDDECASCRRSEQKGRERIGDHFAPVYERTPRIGFCRWCLDHSDRTEAGDLIPPPVEACHIMHTQSARAAALWLDKNRARAA